MMSLIEIGVILVMSLSYREELFFSSGRIYCSNLNSTYNSLFLQRVTVSLVM